MMELKTEYKKINLVFTTRKIVNATRSLQGKNFEDTYFKAMSENDLDSLSKIIYTFAENEDGTKAFKSSEDIYDFIDDYKAENDKSYEDIFRELAEAVNDEGFFKKKMTKEELEQKISNPLSSINMDEVIKQSAEKAISKVAEQQIIAQA